MHDAWPAARELPQERRHRGRLWFALLGGAGSWVAHLLGSYTIAEFGCVGELATRSWNGVTLVAWLCIGLTIVAELVALAALGAAYASRSQASNVEDEATAEPRRYSAMLGMTLNSLFALAILFESVPILYYLRNC